MKWSKVRNGATRISLSRTEIAARDLETLDSTIANVKDLERKFSKESLQRKENTVAVDVREKETHRMGDPIQRRYTVISMRRHPDEEILENLYCRQLTI